MSKLSGFAAAALMALAATGCASSGTTLTQPNRPGSQLIYHISEEQAFMTALEAYAALLPKQSVDDVVEGTRRGYNADQRRGPDWWSEVFPLEWDPRRDGITPHPERGISHDRSVDQ